MLVDFSNGSSQPPCIVACCASAALCPKAHIGSRTTAAGIATKAFENLRIFSESRSQPVLRRDVIPSGKLNQPIRRRGANQPCGVLRHSSRRLDPRERPEALTDTRVHRRDHAAAVVAARYREAV